MKKLSLRNKIRIGWLFLVSLFFIWQASTYQSHGVDKKLMENDENIQVVETKDKISFVYDSTSSLEIIFFPGGLVDPQAYVPLVRSIAESGYNIHIIKMPGRMSTRGYQKIKTLFNLRDSGKKFILGGHSQGAKMAAQFVYENEKSIAGLYLLATSHPRDIDLSSISIPCIKIYAENDGLASVEEVEENKSKLPQGNQLVLINGGNHSQFAYIGNLLMDGKATISREEQHQQTMQLLIEFFEMIQSLDLGE